MPTVVYNSYTLPNVTAPSINGSKFSYHEDYENISFSCTFLVTAATEALLVAACAAAETALSVRYKDFTLQFGSTSEYSYSHSSNTGFLAEPSLEKITDSLATTLARPYRFSLRIKKPAKLTGYNYRLEGNISLDQESKSRLMLTVAGKYTAGGANSATANYTAYGVTWANTIATSFGTFELMNESKSYEMENKIMHFSRRYQQKLTIAVVYNSYNIPASYNNFSISETYDTLSFSCEFAVTHANAAAAESALRMKNADLTMSWNGAAMYSYSHSSNTGFLAQPTLQLISNTQESDTNRFYRFSLVCQLPANASGYNYRREGSYSIRYDAARRATINFSCTYTAGSGSSSLQNYTTYAKTWATGIITALGLTCELVNESVQTEQEAKLTSGSLTYSEVITYESESSQNVAEIVNADASYSVSFAEESGYSAAGYTMYPLATVSINYSCQIDKTLKIETDIEGTYRATIRPWLIKHAATVLGYSNYSQIGFTYIAKSETFSIDPHTYHVRGAITFMAPRNTDAIVMLKETITETSDLGYVAHKLWSGKSFNYSIYNTGASKTARRIITIGQLNHVPAEPKELGGKWFRLRLVKTGEINKIGVGSTGNGTQLQEATMYVASYAEEYIYVEPLV